MPTKFELIDRMDNPVNGSSYKVFRVEPTSVVAHFSFILQGLNRVNVSLPLAMPTTIYSTYERDSMVAPWASMAGFFFESSTSKLLYRPPFPNLTGSTGGPNNVCAQNMLLKRSVLVDAETTFQNIYQHFWGQGFNHDFFFHMSPSIASTTEAYLEFLDRWQQRGLTPWHRTKIMKRSTRTDFIADTLLSSLR